MKHKEHFTITANNFRKSSNSLSETIQALSGSLDANAIKNYMNSAKKNVKDSFIRRPKENKLISNSICSVSGSTVTKLNYPLSSDILKKKYKIDMHPKTCYLQNLPTKKNLSLNNPENIQIISNYDVLINNINKRKIKLNTIYNHESNSDSKQSKQLFDRTRIFYNQNNIIRYSLYVTMFVAIVICLFYFKIQIFKVFL
jgi:hypothetical protein